MGFPLTVLLALEVSDILEAIYLQDKAALRKAISCFPESVNEQDRSGLTTAHLAISWPEGLSILLAKDAKPDTRDKFGDTPLNNACRFLNATHVTSALILLDCDSSLGNQDQNIYLAEIWMSQNTPLKNKFIFHLIDRRSRLLDLAFESLPTWDFERLRLKDDRILDAQAASVIDALLQHDVDIVPTLMPSHMVERTTVYHSVNLDVSTANILFKAGFKDIDGTDITGLTPFSSHALNFRIQFDLWKGYNPSRDFETLKILQWLTDKNVDVYYPHPTGGGKAMHAFGAAVTGRIFSRIHRNCSSTKLLTVQQVRTAGLFLTDAATDDCQCACSTNGCRIITSALKEAPN
jgi:hypothetical protein